MDLTWALGCAAVAALSGGIAPLVFSTSPARSSRWTTILLSGAGGFLLGGTLGSAPGGDYRMLAWAIFLSALGAGAAATDLPPDKIIPHRLTHPSLVLAVGLSFLYGYRTALGAILAGAATFLIIWATPTAGGGDMRLGAALAVGAYAAGGWFPALLVPMGMFLYAGATAMLALSLLFVEKVKYGSFSHWRGRRIPMAPGAALGAGIGLAWAAGSF